jgi:hypothetical protein
LALILSNFNNETDNKLTTFPSGKMYEMCVK